MTGFMTLRQAKARFRQLTARYGDDLPVLFRNMWGLSRWPYGVGLWTSELHEFTRRSSGGALYLIHTGDGHINPVTRVVLLRHRTTSQYAVCIEYDDLIEMG
jgi:hypothetical protein